MYLVFKSVVLLQIVKVIGLCEAASILAVFPSPAKSHQIIYRSVINALIARGHRITLLSPDPLPTDNPNVTQIDWSWTYQIVDREWNIAKNKEENIGIIQFAQTLFRIGHLLMEAQLKHPEVINLIENRHLYHFDVVIVEFFGMPPIFGFGEHFNAPLIGISSFDSIATGHEAVGNVMNPIAHPELIFPFTKNLSFIQRLLSVCFQVYITHVAYPREYERYDKQTRHYFGGNASSSLALMQNIDLLLTYGNPALGYIRPIVPATITFHSMHIEPVKPLPEELQRYLNNSTQGCILISFGTLVKSSKLSDQKLEVFVNTFRSLNYNVLWKWETEELKHKPANVKIVKWLPQQDVLAHPNVKLFITQGGPHSIEEAIDRHVPMIVIPFMTDQYRNGRNIHENLIGISLDINKLTGDKLKNTIIEVITNKR